MRRAYSRIPALVVIALAYGIFFISIRGVAVRLPAQDFAQFWAAAHLAKQNPYSPQLVSQLETSSGLHLPGDPLVMRYPPWALIFVLPLRLMTFPSAFAFWAVLSFTIIAGCGREAWQLYASYPSLTPVFLSLLFGPTVCLLVLAQLAVLVLLGITLFLISVEHRRDWIAGVSLLLVLLKPHVTLLLLLAAMLWAIRYRRWKIVCGAVLALASSSLVAVAVNVHIFGQYLGFARVFVHEEVPYPNLSGIIYAISGSRTLALLPVLAGIVWLVIYWRRHRTSWDWKTHGLMALLASVVCSYYIYPYDEIVVLPALLAAAAQGNRRIFLLGFIPTNIAYALYILNIAGKLGFKYMFLSWTALAWLLTYLLSHRRAAAHAYAKVTGN